MNEAREADEVLAQHASAACEQALAAARDAHESLHECLRSERRAQERADSAALFGVVALVAAFGAYKIYCLMRDMQEERE